MCGQIAGHKFAPKYLLVDRIVLLILFLFLFLLPGIPVVRAQGQETGPFGNKPLRWYLNEDKTHWLGFHTYLQMWGRLNRNNPGTQIFEDTERTTADVSIRRFRLAMQGQLTENLFIYTQLGINNLNYLSPRGTSVDLLDAYAEYRFSEALEVGGGKTAWSGLSRYSAPNTSKLLSYDLIFLALPTNDETNDLIRKLSLYAKGKLGKLDYRLVTSKPFSVQNSDDFDPVPEVNIAKFADNPSGRSYSGYLKWEFADRESNKIPFSNGSYLGGKSVMNIGVGMEFQSDALWHLQNGDTVFNNMVLWAVDFFVDRPVNKTQNTAFTFYAGYFNYDFGPNYTKNIGANNPANAVGQGVASFNGPGNAFPAVGTGESLFTQTGYLFPYMGPSGRLGQLQPYLSFQYSDFERLDDPMLYYDIGINWLFHGHLSKLSLNFQNRPVFLETQDRVEVDGRKLMVVLQYIIRLE